MEDINKLDENGATPLMRAVVEGDEELVRSLLEKGALPDVRDSNGETPLLYITRFEHWNSERGKIIVELLLKYGASVNLVNEEIGNGWSALVYACDNGDLEIAKILIAHGANVNFKPAKNGWTPLAVACFWSFVGVEIVQLLLDSGALVNGPSDTICPLLCASTKDKKNSPKVKLLLEKGARVDCLEAGTGATPLMFASANGTVESVKLLLKYGADVTRADNEGKTALDQAIKFKQKEIEKLLLQHGAKK